jgi:hypothetical protein
MRAALYARVSTHDQQTLGMQVDSMRSDIEDRGLELTRQIKDVGSGAKQRSGCETPLKAARRCMLDIVVVWRLGRWGRSLPGLAVTLRELTDLGIGFVSLMEALDLTMPTGTAMAGMLAVFAEFEVPVIPAPAWRWTSPVVGVRCRADSRYGGRSPACVGSTGLETLWAWSRTTLPLNGFPGAVGEPLVAGQGSRDPGSASQNPYTVRGCN